MDVLLFLTLFVSGFTACAEFGSYAFVHPVIKRLEPRAHVMVEQGLVKTFGRVMPVLMTSSAVLVISFALGADESASANVSAVAAAALWTLGLITTIAVNVGINRSTAGWDADQPPERWKEVRNRWELFQAIRSWAFLLSFLLVCLSVTLSAP